MKTTFAVAVALNAAALFASAVHAQAPAPAIEKCFGIAKAGHNDCQTKRSSCAATSKRDGQPDAWVGVTKGTCAKIVGGTLEPAQG